MLARHVLYQLSYFPMVAHRLDEYSLGIPNGGTFLSPQGWSGWQESNLRAPGPEPGGLPLTHTPMVETLGFEPREAILPGLLAATAVPIEGGPP